MAISVDWVTGVITVPQADLTFISGILFELDINTFRLALKDLEASQEGAPYPDTHAQRTSEVLLAGVTFARIIEIIPPYTVTFEDGLYVVELVGANSNIKDRTNRNQVSIGSNNSGGLINANTAEAVLDAPASDHDLPDTIGELLNRGRAR